MTSIYWKKVFLLITLLLALCGCAMHSKRPPVVALDEAMLSSPAILVNEPTLAIEEIADTATDLKLEVKAAEFTRALSGQQLPLEVDNPTTTESTDARERVAQANRDALVAPTREGYINAIQVWPYSDGALYQVYTSPGRVTAIMLQPGESLVAVSAGDTVRWIVGDTSSGTGAERRVQILVKPIRADLKTNLVITTDRRTYLLDMCATARAWMASVSWDYPQERLTALKIRTEKAEAAAPVASGIALEQLKFRYEVSGDNPSWKPLRAFDDGERVYIQFPSGIAQGELPPLFVVGPQGDAELVNYRFRSPYYVVDRLFGAAELRLGGSKSQVVRISRTDGVRRAGL